jgi:transposase InsO family protein
MEGFYRHVGISRQGFCKKAEHSRKERQMVQEITRLVDNYRKTKDRRAGSRSLYYNLDIKTRLGIGISKFEQIMSVHGLSLVPLRIRVVTTRSSMQSWNYSNLINGLSINDINQVVAGDLTYVSVNGSRNYLFCLTDLYSARIVGYHLGPNMRAEDAKHAFDQWVGLRGKQNLKGCIHHTDGGSQYFSGLYLSALDQLEALVSCAKNCLMNGYAEQRNGLIKHHLLPTVQAVGTNNLSKQISRCIGFYNEQRKQKGLGWLSPVGFEKKIAGFSSKPQRNLYTFNLNGDGFKQA